MARVTRNHSQSRGMAGVVSLTTILTTTATTTTRLTTATTGRNHYYCARSRLLPAPGSVEVRGRFIRSASATPFGLRALNPQHCSSSSSLTSTNVSLLTSRQPEKRKVAGSIPALATRRINGSHPCRLREHHPLRGTAAVPCPFLLLAASTRASPTRGWKRPRSPRDAPNRAGFARYPVGSADA